MVATKNQQGLVTSIKKEPISFSPRTAVHGKVDKERNSVSGAKLPVVLVSPGLVVTKHQQPNNQTLITKYPHQAFNTLAPLMRFMTQLVVMLMMVLLVLLVLLVIQC